MNTLKRLGQDKSTAKKLIALLLSMFAIAMGSRIPIPGVDMEKIRIMSSPLLQGGGSFMDILMGNTLSSMSIFALNVSPYITATILAQILGAVIPPIKRMRENPDGKQKMKLMVYGIALIAALIQGGMLASSLTRSNIFYHNTFWMAAAAVAMWTAGACFLVWYGNFISERLLGNGISIILSVNILTSLPVLLVNAYETYGAGAVTMTQTAVIAAIIAGLCVMGVLVIAYQTAEIRIPVANASRFSGGIGASKKGVLPIRLCIGGVMPIIFASTVMSFPSTVMEFLQIDQSSAAWDWVSILDQRQWFNPGELWRSAGIIPYAILVVFFSGISAKMEFNPREIADSLRKSGSSVLVPGIRPGNPTAEFLEKRAKEARRVGTAMLLTAVLFPSIVCGVMKVPNLAFTGTTFIILASTYLEVKSAVIAGTAFTQLKTKNRSWKNG